MTLIINQRQLFIKSPRKSISNVSGAFFLLLTDQMIVKLKKKNRPLPIS